MNMNILSFLFIFIFNQKNIKNDIINKIYEQLKLPIWHKNNINCETDYDCPLPFACCHDAFFPMKDKYCCINYKKREYKYTYNYNYIK
jgi:hypothetical protein